MSEGEREIQIKYSGAIIEFDSNLEEWVAFWEDEFEWRQEFKRNSSLKKVQEAIDRFHRKEFQPIPILLFDFNGNLLNAEITSFTPNPGECWIKYWDDKREKINTLPNKKGHKKIYACGNISNEPLILKIFELDKEIQDISRQLQQKQKERIHIKDRLEVFDISGYAVSE